MAAAAIVAVHLQSLPAWAEDTSEDSGFIELLPEVPEVTLDIQHAQKIMRVRQFGVLDLNYRWDSSSFPLRICFFGGSSILRARIANAAREWEIPTSAIRFDFGSPASPRTCADDERNDIRISFDRSGFFSLVAREGYKVRQTEPSMNFQDWHLIEVGNAKLRRIVRHEFGHALGLHHEHQNPRSACVAELRTTEIIALLTGPQYGLTATQAERQIQRLHPDDVDATDFDGKSIMIYSFPPEFYVGGRQATCFRQSNHEISPTDRNFVQALFPRKS